ncbi:CDK-activating kinase assembly factor [Saitoella complicata NRRL Y-17804]|uniref:CDK-activating kinase assembly factor n=1 Tax=Saitoella complicata (strain BCRC 22490 / CBS 7301 / JCM 7358 / NBRC 10748 / NRRL Y-17804) TaxID=698492 RepID=UPI0008675340|nr:CDK-activating kinase assembly factor [Saitoella complicata NRRL Y-17804]ODQ50090.1 CDK-activating kinase assembly factor [Saitoella complicata NRRL Y-17804]
MEIDAPAPRAAPLGSRPHRVCSSEADGSITVCPSCSKDSYVNPHLELLINPECYHKLCTSCIDSLFTLGPAPCPLCGKILRKNKFRKQTFEDITVERELDIRKRVAKIYNRRPEEFDSLRAYNDYLEEYEIDVFNLVNGIDIQETEAKLEKYAGSNRKEIAANAARAVSEAQALQQQEAARKVAAKEARQQALLDEEEERREKAEDEAGLLKALAAAGNEKDSARIVKAHEQRVAHRAQLRAQRRRERDEALAAQFTDMPAFGAPRPKIEEEDDTPFDPLGGEGMSSAMYVVQSNYDDIKSMEIVRNPEAVASGFNVTEVFRKALFSAFAGLGCDVGAETEAREALDGDVKMQNAVVA